MKKCDVSFQHIAFFMIHKTKIILLQFLLFSWRLSRRLLQRCISTLGVACVDYRDSWCDFYAIEIVCFNNNCFTGVVNLCKA